jgi:pyruvate,water dikinase
VLSPLAPGLDPAEVGGKAAVLGELTALDVGVPPGWALPVAVCRAFHEQGALPEAVVAALHEVAGRSPDALWAVRSSGTQEDGAALSFAGQFASCLDVRGEDLVDAVGRCYRSAGAARLAAYNHHAGLAPDPLIGVVVQRMARATASAVVFTVDPVTGADTVAVAEVAPGPGADLVGGRVTARTYRHDWLWDRPAPGAAPPEPGGDPVGPAALANLWEAVWRVQEWAGAPCDIEAVFDGDSVAVVQSRPVTAVGHAGVEDVWTTADFRDGGVSSGVFPPFMWSLYEYIWERAFPDFLVGLGTLPAKRRRRASRVFYGRPYWNAQMAKEAMAKVPGYVEREFDEDLGIAPAYEGDGAVTRLTPRSALTMAKVGLTELIWVRRRLKTAARLKAGLEARHEARLKELAGTAADGLPALFTAITKDDYLASESAYFRQIFINQAHQPLVRARLGKFCDQADYLALIGGLGGGRDPEAGPGPGPGGRGAISHLAPFHDLWELSRRVLADPVEARWWLETEPGQIAAALEDGSTIHPHVADLRGWLDRYGYHSERELDITRPSFAEDPAAAVRQLKANLELGEQASPALDAARAEAARGAALDRLRAKAPPRRHRALAAQVDQMRELLWWREAFRDVSTKQYHLIRQVALRLAGHWARTGVIERVDDFWFAQVGQVWAVAEGRATPAWLRGEIFRQRRYFTAYRNHRGPEEIGARTGVRPQVGPGRAGQRFQGVGCQASSGRGRARVVESLDQIGRLAQGDVLVTRFTDTGWTPAFARLGGVVTEYGGMLCHAAIVSREFDIPCVVALAGATCAIPDGALVEVDGAAGTVTVLEVG